MPLSAPPPAPRPDARSATGPDAGPDAADRATVRSRTAFVTCWVILGLTVAQLGVAAVASGTDAVRLEQFEGKAFGARLIAYPLLMLAVPAAWWAARRWGPGRTAPRQAGAGAPLPWATFAWIMLPFLVDVTGNTLDLYDSVTWWDDANHLVNWFFLALGSGLLLALAQPRPGWMLPLAITGLGAVLAIGWEAGEWYTFIRHGTELDTAYQDTLGDLVLGTLGAAIAAVVVWLRERRRRNRP